MLCYMIWHDMLWCDMIYDIIWCLLQLGFHPVAVVGRLVEKYESDSTKGEKILKQYKITKYTKIKQKYNTT